MKLNSYSKEVSSFADHNSYHVLASGSDIATRVAVDPVDVGVVALDHFSS